MTARPFSADTPTASLFRLDNIKDTDRIAADGATLQGRMQGLMEQVARDIRDCANVCDTYRSKSIVGKTPAKLLRLPRADGVGFYSLQSKSSSHPHGNKG